MARIAVGDEAETTTGRKMQGDRADHYRHASSGLISREGHPSVRIATRQGVNDAELHASQCPAETGARDRPGSGRGGPLLPVKKSWDPGGNCPRFAPSPAERSKPETTSRARSATTSASLAVVVGRIDMTSTAICLASKSARCSAEILGHARVCSPAPPRRRRGLINRENLHDYPRGARAPPAASRGM
jgi:hypothetical protein